MRTRFLNIDYFTSNTSSSSIQNLNFLNLPVPSLSASRLFTFKDDILRFDSVLDVSLDIEQLPIHSAFSKFFSEVIPQVIDVDYSDFEDRRTPIQKCCDSQTESDILHEEKEERTQRTFAFKALENAVDEKNTQKFDVIQFETPTLDVFLENVSLSEKEEAWIVSRVPEIDNDMLKPGLAIQYPSEIQESVYSVEDVTLDYHVEKKNYNLDDDSSLPDQMLFQCMFPLLEVDEISPGILTSLSVEDEFHSVLEKLEHQHWTQKHNLFINGKEILGSLEYDTTLNFLLDYSSSKPCLESQLVSMDMFLEMDFISMVENVQLKENSEFLQVMAYGDCFLSMSPAIFEEFEMSDVDSSKLFETIFGIQKTIEPVACGWMFREDTNFKNFNELIISYELALIDDTFKSLPVPVFCDYENIRSVYAILEEKLAVLKPQPLSASDGIYLDWYLLEGDKCSCEIVYCQQEVLKDVNSCNIDLDIVSSDDEKLVSDFIFSDNNSSRTNMEGCEESPSIDFVGISVLDCHIMGVSSDKVIDNESPKPRSAEQSSEKNVERASLLFKSLSEFNDLDFFLNPRNAVTKQNDKSAVKEADTIAPSNNFMVTGFSSDVQLQQWDMTLYKVMLSENIVALISFFEKCYLAIVRNETELHSFMASDDFRLLSLPKQQLMDCINKKKLQKATSHGDENSMAYATLCAIKQMAWYTCFYGIHTAHLYVDKLCKSWDCFKSRLGSLQSLIADADRKLDKEITRSHPSLLVIQGILQSNNSQSNLKVLILAEQAFWWSLKCLIMSMGLSCDELPKLNILVDKPDVTNVSQFANAKMDDLPISDCLLASHEVVSASFPFHKFSLILEYGGSYGSSRISTLSPKLAGLPRLHFLKVELDDSSASRALCEGVDMPQNTEVGGKFQSIPNPDENMSALKLHELLNFLPVEDRVYIKSEEAAANVEACGIPPSVPCSQLPIDSKQIHQRMPSSPNAVIITNTQNSDKEMLVSRRSTYQRILAMENVGVQVVERDSDLPVDIIISSAICLIWYDRGNIGKKATALDEASSCLPFCVENIATNVLTLLSFTFSSCILVLEGETNFICTVMESSDGLYAAAASLGLDLQLFYSYSSELTDEIILSCIGYSIKSTNGLYPKMNESETLAESFLTKFPSVNPLTAHAMLSSVGMLMEFLECSHKNRVLAIQKYCVPEESINLFSILCKYGEREDSKSVMTDCSSSVSSGADSDKCHLNVDSERKQQKCIYDPYKSDIPMDDFLVFEPLNQFANSTSNPTRMYKPYDSWNNHDIFDENEKPSSSLNDLFGRKQELDFDIMMKPSIVSNASNAQILECPQISKEVNNRNFSLKDGLLTENQRPEIATMTNLTWHNISGSGNVQEDFIGEVVDLTSCPGSGKEILLAPKSFSLSPSVPEMENNSTRKSTIARKLSFGKSSHPTFPTAAEINSGSGILYPGKDSRQIVQGTNDHPDTEYNNDQLLLEHRKNILHQVLGRRIAGFKGVPFQEEISHYGGTPLSNAIHSANPQPGSPWTMEFLNRIKEKSRLRQQSHPCDTAAPCYGISGNISKGTKRRSPSILEFFKYQGGSTSGKFPDQKKQKQSIRSSSSSKSKNSSTSFLPTWTPIDKRARQTLSFAVNESGSQTKLVWTNGRAQAMGKSFLNQ